MAGYTTKTKEKLPRLDMAPYAIVEWLVQAIRMPNELRLCMEKKNKDDTNFQKDDWELFNKFVV